MSPTLGSCTVLLALTLVCGLAAQAPPEKNADKGDVPKEKVNKENDPTQPSQELKDLLNKKKEGEAPITFRLLGKVIGKNRPPIAILKIGDEELMVSKNDIVETSKVRLKIVEISSAGVRLELDSAKPGNKIYILR
jgi:hypothetical protein